MKGKVLIFSLALLVLMSSTLEAVNVGEQAPGFEYTDLEGNKVSLEDLAGKVVFIFVFGNQCGLCRAVGNRTETEVYQVFKDNPNFVAIGIDTWDHSSSVTSVQSFINATGITYTMLLHGGSFASLYGTQYDRVLVIGQDGVLRYKGLTAVSGTLGDAVTVIEDLLTMADVQDEVSAPLAFDLEQNYPNPFNPATQIPVTLSAQSTLRLAIFDLLGRPVLTLADGVFPAGRHIFTWQAANSPTGVYFYKLELDGQTFTRKMVYQR